MGIGGWRIFALWIPGLLSLCEGKESVPFGDESSQAFPMSEVGDVSNYGRQRIEKFDRSYTNVHGQIGRAHV